MLSRLAAYIHGLTHRRAIDDEVDEELQFHLEQEIDALVARGLVPDEARRRAHLALGGRSQTQDAVRDVRTIWLDTLVRDTRQAVRGIYRSPSLAALAVFTMAMAIGVNGAVFAVSNAILFGGLPFEGNDRIVRLQLLEERSQTLNTGISYARFDHWRLNQSSFRDLGAFFAAQMTVARKDGTAELLAVAVQTSNTLRLTGRLPLLGRYANQTDEQAGAAAVVVISHEYWARQYLVSPSVVGEQLILNGESATIVGVMPPDFSFPANVDAWLVLRAPTARAQMEQQNLTVVGRLADGISFEQAQADITILNARFMDPEPKGDSPATVIVQKYSDHALGRNAGLLAATLWGAVSFVLLIACANVANIQFARAGQRAREIATKLALGASRSRVISEMLLDSTLIAIAAGSLGLIIAWWASNALEAIAATMGKPRWMSFAIDTRTIGYLSVLSLGSVVLFGLFPALHLSRAKVVSSLRDGGRGVVDGVRRQRWSRRLLVAQLAVSLMLLAGATIMIRSFLNLEAAPLGVDTRNVLTMHVSLPGDRYSLPVKWATFYEGLAVDIEAMPGVTSVAFATAVPMGGAPLVSFELEEEVLQGTSLNRTVATVVVSDGYFRTWNTPVLHGRSFDKTDRLSLAHVAIVNEAFASTFLVSGDVIGRRIRSGTDTPWLQIVGVVGNIAQRQVGPQPADPIIYLPLRQRPSAGMALMVKTVVPPETLATAISRHVDSLDRFVPVSNIWSMEERVRKNASVRRLVASLFAVLAVIALALAVTGLSGLVAASVGQRTKEIGLRMAVGATAGRIVWLIVGDVATQIAIGLLLGLGAAFLTTRVLRSMLTGLSPVDPLSFSAAVAVLLLAASMAILLPVLRAVRIDPVAALHSE